MTEGAKELLNSGVLGALVVVLFGLLAWAFRAMFQDQRDALQAFKVFMQGSIDAQKKIADSVDAIRTNCLACRQDGARVVRDEADRICGRLATEAALIRGDVDGIRKTTVGAAEVVEQAAEQLSEAVAQQRTPNPVVVSPMIPAGAR